MASKRTTKATKKVKALKAKSVAPGKAKGVKGGFIWFEKAKK